MKYIGSGYRKSRKQHHGYSFVRSLPCKRNIDENRGMKYYSWHGSPLRKYLTTLMKLAASVLGEKVIFSIKSK